VWPGVEHLTVGTIYSTSPLARMTAHFA